MKKNIEKATEKIAELLDCENERVVLSAAKEIISMAEPEENNTDIKLEVEIKIVE